MSSDPRNLAATGGLDWFERTGVVRVEDQESFPWKTQPRGLHLLDDSLNK